MTHIDFIIAFALTVGIIFFAIFFINSNFSREFNYFRTIELEKAASSLERQLFEIHDDKSLISDFKKIQVLLKEVGNRTHTEQINISIEPVINKLHVYDNFMNEIPSEKTIDGNKVFLTFVLSFSPYGKRRINIIYDGGQTTYMGISSQNDIESRIISEKNIPVVSQEKCSKLNSLEYNNARNAFGFEHHFKINLTDCNYGLEPPTVANIILKEIPVLIERYNELISATNARMTVW